MTEPVKLAVAGALGRMGHAVVKAAHDRPQIEVVARFDRDLALSGEPGLVDRARALSLAEVVVDFTSGAASAELAGLAAARGGPALVIGSTGFTADDDAAIIEAARRVAIVRSGNFSLGVNVLLGLVAQAARALGPAAYDIEVTEAHHRRKVDAPSGTALMLGEAAAQGRGVALEDSAVRTRDGVTGPRPDGAIGFSVIRGGGIVGEHSVMFCAEDEILTLSHSARDRSLFARGAVEAALWVRGRPPGLYDMRDVLGFR
ncbi:MAG: 4-hydroxy-tetrahydrodipicolinate reductase [Caulobacterales bacterium 32-69-10]|nr:MAG: 4-hydroxy-tetrahydrodipicolinate reductase [Caulobacterales bacterium 32-69-10]